MHLNKRRFDSDGVKVKSIARYLLPVCLAVLLTGCAAATEPAPAAQPTVASEAAPTEPPVEEPLPAAESAPADELTAEQSQAVTDPLAGDPDSDQLVTIGFWKTMDCSGEPIGVNVYPVDYADERCYDWPGNSGENSATNFICGENSFTYTQWTTLTCSGGKKPEGTVKTAYTDQCTQDVPPTLYARILDFSGCAAAGASSALPESIYTDFYSGRNAEGLAAVEAILETEPDNAAALALRAAFNFRLSENEADMDRTLADAKRAIELDPELAWGWMARAWYYATLEPESTGLDDRDLAKALELDPDLALAYAIRGSILLYQGDLEGARVEYEHAAELRPDYLVAYRNLGDIYLNLGSFEAALKAYSSAIAIDPQFAPTLSWRGHTYIYLGDYDAAVADYTSVIEILGDDPNAYLDRAFGYDVSGDFESALADFEKAIALDPNNSYAYNGAAYSMAQHDYELQKALDYANKAIQLADEDPEAYASALDTQAFIYYKKGRVDEALPIFTALLEGDPPYTIAYYGRGLTYKALDEKDKAIIDLKKFLEYYPNYPQLSADALAHLEALGDEAP